MELSRIATLLELLRIPSVSADPADAADVREALDWVVSFVGGAGGEAQIVDGVTGSLVVGKFAASHAPELAPTVLCYGHVDVDVQPPALLELFRVS